MLELSPTVSSEYSISNYYTAPRPSPTLGLAGEPPAVASCSASALLGLARFLPQLRRRTTGVHCGCGRRDRRRLWGQISLPGRVGRLGLRVGVGSEEDGPGANVSHPPPTHQRWRCLRWCRLHGRSDRSYRYLCGGSIRLGYRWRIAAVPAEGGEACCYAARCATWT